MEKTESYQQLHSVNLANTRAAQVRVPSGFDWRPRDMFSKQSGMKSHEWKQVATHGILKFCMRNTRTPAKAINISAP